ncbi:unnamed protein product [Polarella glacialis]|uniref:PAP-associated domain-containing protein n=1 Tax=Polarella glacialis TaxID=89957 RepID=A0A813K5S3_POLGL|nr:unnamed protein product [Polarella glacialis]
MSFIMQTMNIDSLRKADGRTATLVVAATLCAVLPLEIHHLLAGLVGALGYMLFQALQPKVQRRSKLSPEPTGRTPQLIDQKPADQNLPEQRTPPWRASSLAAAGQRRAAALAEDQRWSTLRSGNRVNAVSPSQVSSTTSPSKREVRKPSAVPVHAPTFQASGWEAEVSELLQRISPTKESNAAVEAIVQAVRRSLLSALPEAEVAGFACGNPLSGTAFGVAVPEADIVLTVKAMPGRSGKSTDMGKLQKALIRTCTDKLVGSGAFKFRRSAFRGSEPKVTLIAPAGAGQSIPINLSVNAASPFQCAALFEACGRLDSRAKDVILLVRRWAKDRGVSHAAKGHLSPYTWTLLAIYYLQAGLATEDGPLLPPLASFVKSSQLPMASSAKSGSKTAAELFKGFLDFYTHHFDWRNEAVSVRLGQRSPPAPSLPVHVLLHSDGKTTQVGPSIEDPFEASENLGECMNWLAFGRLREELARGHELCSSGDSLALLLEPWSPPEHQQDGQGQQE